MPIFYDFSHKLAMEFSICGIICGQKVWSLQYFRFHDFHIRIAHPVQNHNITYRHTPHTLNHLYISCILCSIKAMEIFVIWYYLGNNEERR